MLALFTYGIVVILFTFPPLPFTDKGLKINIDGLREIHYQKKSYRCLNFTSTMFPLSLSKVLKGICSHPNLGLK